MYNLLWICFLLHSGNSLIKSFLPKHARPKHMLMTINDYVDTYIQDINWIQNEKAFFVKDNYAGIDEALQKNEIVKLYIDNTYKQLVSVTSDQSTSLQDYHIAPINTALITHLVDQASEKHIPLYFIDFASHVDSWINTIGTAATYIVPFFLFPYIVVFVRNLFMSASSSSYPNNMNLKNQGSFGMPPMFQKDTSSFMKQNISLDNWAGSPEVLEECYEVISYIENKERFEAIGAVMPKGILLEGPPGTGKTLLAKAIASQTNTSFISISGSEFVELFVGMGAARVRELFQNARKNKPCIVFIDEIDAVGKQRGSSANIGSNDEREQTLNQLLYEMDGFNNNDDILILAATNRKDILDQALLRPGRFDRLIRVPLPDKRSREKILEFYLQDKKTEGMFDVEAIADLTDGFSGAQLKNVINEAAILSVKNNYNTIHEEYVYEAFEKLLVGIIKKNATIAPETNDRVAIHESGHALLALLYNDTFDFQKVSIQPTYNGAGGYTIFSEKQVIREGGLYTKEMLKKRLVVALGGKAAETLYYGNDQCSQGVVEDLRQANQLARKMVGNYGMGDLLEPFFNEDTAGDTSFVSRSNYAETTRTTMDTESLHLVQEAFLEAKRILQNHYEDFLLFSFLLKKKKVMQKKDLPDEFSFPL